MDIKEVIQQNVAALSAKVCRDCPLPSPERLGEVMRLVRALLFPEFFDSDVTCATSREYFIGVNLERLYEVLREQIACVLPAPGEAERISTEFLAGLPELRRLLLTDVEAVFRNDPAVDNRGEVIFCYPGVQAMTNYRTAHALLRLGVPVIPRILTERAHSRTGIDIHPGATIGEYFAIDHGTGVVIGQTCIIGNHVTIYQGVTLGSRNFTLNEEGHPVNLPRHPIIEDDVTIYSNASVLGRITIGRGAVIGGNVWVTHSVPAGARITQQGRE